MKKALAAATVLLYIVATLLACSNPPKPTPEEEGVLMALTLVQKGYDKKATYNEFSNLLNTAAGKIEQLKRAANGNSCFLNAATKCYASYEISKKAWKLKEEAQDENRRLDMETTLAFSIGFASVSLAKANECFLDK